MGLVHGYYILLRIKDVLVTHGMDYVLGFPCSRVAHVRPI